MPDIVSDIVDVYVFRHQNARIQFLLLQRKASVPLGNTWQSFHTQIQGHETTIGATRRAIRELSGLNVSEAYSADYVNEFYDDTRDVIVLAPVIAVNVSAQAPVTLGHELKECAWWDTNQAIARLPFSGQRWAIKHISDLMSEGYEQSQLYRLLLPSDVAIPSSARREQEADEKEAPPFDLTSDHDTLPNDVDSIDAMSEEELDGDDIEGVIEDVLDDESTR